MSVVVRMEMPGCCWDCPCLDDYGDYPRCRISNEQRGYTFPIREKRMPKCPITQPLPEGHGRLVDADEIIEAIDEDIELDSRGLDDMTITGRVRERLRLDRGYKKGFKEYLVKRPTIIPATEGGKE